VEMVKAAIGSRAAPSPLPEDAGFRARALSELGGAAIYRTLVSVSETETQAAVVLLLAFDAVISQETVSMAQTFIRVSEPTNTIDGHGKEDCLLEVAKVFSTCDIALMRRGEAEKGVPPMIGEILSASSLLQRGLQRRWHGKDWFRPDNEFATLKASEILDLTKAEKLNEAMARTDLQYTSYIRDDGQGKAIVLEAALAARLR
jgi:hypothetical protein